MIRKLPIQISVFDDFIFNHIQMLRLCISVVDAINHFEYHRNDIFETFQAKFTFNFRIRFTRPGELRLK